MNTVIWKRKLSEDCLQSQDCRTCKTFLSDFICLLHYCRGMFPHSSLQRCFSSLRSPGIRWCAALLSLCHSTSIRLKSALYDCNTLILFLFLFNDSVVDLLLCLQSLSCCMIHFQSSCQTDGFKFDYRILWCAEEFMADSITARTATLKSRKM